MNKHILATAVIALVCVLVLAGATSAQSGSQPSPPWYTVEQGRASGGRYHLTSSSWHVSGAASGGGYRLLSPSSPTLRGNGCCCTYMPCVLRNQH